MLKTGKPKSIKSAGMVVRHLISLSVYIAPLVIVFLKFSTQEKSEIITIAGISMALAGRVISLFGSYKLREKSTDLVTSSIFNLTRHPIALGMHFTLFGVILIVDELSLWIGVPFYLWNMHDKIIREEKFLIKRFGIKYRSYMIKTPRYLWK